MKVLIVDDESDITLILTRGLEISGYSVTAFNRPADALKHGANAFDIAILDIRMPEMNGFQLARKLWQQNTNLRVCFLSAFEIYEAEARRTLPSLKSYCFLKKPITPAALAAHIQMHFASQ
ncbi:MAG: response regulator [Nitrososphaera sp.]